MVEPVSGQDGVLPKKVIFEDKSVVFVCRIITTTMNCIFYLSKGFDVSNNSQFLLAVVCRLKLEIMQWHTRFDIHPFVTLLINKLHHTSRQYLVTNSCYPSIESCTTLYIIGVHTVSRRLIIIRNKPYGIAFFFFQFPLILDFYSFYQKIQLCIFFIIFVMLIFTCKFGFMS